MAKPQAEDVAYERLEGADPSTAPPADVAKDGEGTSMAGTVALIANTVMGAGVRAPRGSPFLGPLGARILRFRPISSDLGPPERFETARTCDPAAWDLPQRRLEKQVLSLPYAYARAGVAGGPALVIGCGTFAARIGRRRVAAKPRPRRGDDRRRAERRTHSFWRCSVL